MEKCQTDEQSFCTLQPDGNMLNSAFSDSRFYVFEQQQQKKDLIKEQ